MPNNPCQHQGTCQTESSDYKCKCSEDWEGKNCEYESDSCLSEPCKHVRKSSIYTFAFCPDSVFMLWRPKTNYYYPNNLI